MKKEKKVCKTCVHCGISICLHPKRGIWIKKVCKYYKSNGATEGGTMKRMFVTLAVLAFVGQSSIAGDLFNPRLMMAAADKAVAGASTPVMTDNQIASGITVLPTADGAVASVNVNQAKDSVKKRGVWETIKAIPTEYPKTLTAATVLGIAIPIIANNPRLIGIDDKDDASASSSSTSTRDNSVHVTITGNTSSTISIDMQNPYNAKRSK